MSLRASSRVAHSSLLHAQSSPLLPTYAQPFSLVTFWILCHFPRKSGKWNPAYQQRFLCNVLPTLLASAAIAVPNLPRIACI